MEFFTKNDLEYYSSVIGNRFKKGDPEFNEIGRVLKEEGVIAKTNYWAKLLENEGYSIDPKSHWQIAGVIRRYTWASIYIKGFEDSEVFFTVGVGSRLSDNTTSLEYKLDCQRNKLTKTQRKNFDEYLINELGEYPHIKIEIEDLENYSWERVKEETKNFIKKHSGLYKEGLKVVEGKFDKEKRVARVCWNDRGWVEPSGPYGKSKDIDTHEGKYGYGHEEWLFDPQNRFEGYQYGFLEPIKQGKETYQNQKFDIWLYTLNGITKKRLYVGVLKDVEVLSEEQIENQAAHILNNERKKYMMEQVIAAEAIPNTKSKWNGIDNLNIRFKWENRNILDDPIPLPKGHPIWNIHRYTFAQYQDEFGIDINGQTLKERFEEHKEPTESDNDETSIYTRESKQVEVKDSHKKITKNLIQILKKKYGDQNAKKEFLLDTGKKVDIAVSKNDGFIFYEIKTYNSVRYSIREAIGQLLEYSYWPKVENANELIIVCEPHPDIEEAKKYIAYLRQKFKMKIFLQTYDLKENKVSEIYR